MVSKNTFCAYCKQGNLSGVTACEYCGAPFGDGSLREDYRIRRGEPMFYNGYMLWPEYVSYFESDVKRLYFWLGDRLVETIELPVETIRSLVKEGESNLPLFWDLFCLTQEPGEVLRIQEQNTIRPATFEIRAIVERPPTYDELMATFAENRYA